MAETIMDSLSGLEYTLRPSIYKIHEDQNYELLDVAEQGKIILHGVIVAADEICGIVKKTIVPFAQ